MERQFFWSRRESGIGPARLFAFHVFLSSRPLGWDFDWYVSLDARFLFVQQALGLGFSDVENTDSEHGDMTSSSFSFSTVRAKANSTKKRNLIPPKSVPVVSQQTSYERKVNLMALWLVACVSDILKMRK